MSVSILFPDAERRNVEERFTSAQAQLLLRSQGDGKLLFYEPRERAADVAGAVDTDFVLVITDARITVGPSLVERLTRLLEESGADAAVPLLNQAGDPRQRRPLSSPFLTLRQVEETIAAIGREPNRSETIRWGREDPFVFLCRTQLLSRLRAPLGSALEGREVALSHSDYVHRWGPLPRAHDELLAVIDRGVGSLLELGCGDGSLGAAVKQRQRCRVVGIELDPAAAGEARRRIDDVYRGDVRELVDILDERFDCIVANGLVGRLDDPWSFLGSLRRLSARGGRLLFRATNLANASTISDLLEGRFDTVYTSAGLIRFFTRKSIVELVAMSGWSLETIIPRPLAIPEEGTRFREALGACGITASEDLLAAGYLVVARNTA